MRNRRLWMKVAVLLVPVAMLAAVACTPSEAQMIDGMLQNVDSANGKITVVTNEGKTIELTIDTEAPVSANGSPAEVSALEPGVSVKVEVDDNGGVAMKIEARQGKVEGVVSALSGSDVTVESEKGGSVTLHVGDSTKIELEEEVDGSLADLSVGLAVEARFDPATNAALKIELADEELEAEGGRIRGLIEEISGGSLTIVGEEGLTVTVMVNEDTRIDLRHGVDGTLADLAAGMSVDARFDLETMAASRVQVKEAGDEMAKEDQVKGEITAIADGKLTIMGEEGLTVSVGVNEDTRIDLRHGENGALADLKAGMDVQAKFDTATSIASRIQVEGSGSN